MVRRSHFGLPLIMGLLSVLLFLAPARGQDSFEIEVYGSETLPRGETSLELHSVFNAESDEPQTTGVYPSHHSLNESIEIAHGFTDSFQGSFYVLTPRIRHTVGSGREIDYVRRSGYRKLGTGQ